MSKEFILDIILGERGFSVADLTRMTGLGRSTIDDIRRKGGGRRENLDKIAAALGIGYEDLYRDKDDYIPESSEATMHTVESTYDNSELLNIAERYRDEGNELLYQKLTVIAHMVGKDVNRLLDSADKCFAKADYEKAAGDYARAVLSLKPRHVSRLRKSLANYLAICEMEKDIQPIINLMRKINEPQYRDFEILCKIVEFLANNRVNEILILESIEAVTSIHS